MAHLLPKSSHLPVTALTGIRREVRAVVRIPEGGLARRDISFGRGALTFIFRCGRASSCSLRLRRQQLAITDGCEKLYLVITCTGTRCLPSAPKKTERVKGENEPLLRRIRGSMISRPFASGGDRSPRFFLQSLFRAIQERDDDFHADLESAHRISTTSVCDALLR